MVSAFRTIVAAAALSLAPGCGPDGRDGGSASGDGGPDASSAADVPTTDADDATPDAAAEGGNRAGPLSLVSTETTVSTERPCDHDGDGVGDNAVADLGNPSAELFAAMVSTSLSQGILAGDRRSLLHLPWVDDLSGPIAPEVTVVALSGVDADDPADPEDDFSGHEPFYADADDLDACSEPRLVLRGSLLDGGRLTTEPSEDSPSSAGLQAHSVAISAAIAPWGTEADIIECSYALASELGGVLAGETGTTFLEVLLAGGAAVGVPHVPGLTPDLDLDGDGLERFVLDEGLRIASCIDGDTTVIEGRDCWRDPRIADGFSLVVHSHAVGASVIGPEPGWEERAQGTCGGYHRCVLGCADDFFCDCDPPCGPCEPCLSLLESCMAERCDGPCATDFSYSQCNICIAAECAAERASCVAIDCCPEPPEASLWDAP